MKRRDLERKLRIAGCYLKREVKSHSLWINPKTGVIEAVPRHNEIKEPLAKKDTKEFKCRVEDNSPFLRVVKLPLCYFPSENR